VFDHEPEPVVEAPADLGGDAPAVEAPAAPEYVSQADYEQLVGAVSYLSEQLQAQQNGGSQQQQQQLDPLADDFQSQFDRYLETKLAPFTEFQHHVQANEGTQQFKDVIHDLQQANGEFLLPDTAKRAMPLARDLYPEFVQRFGHNDRAAEMAIEKAYETLKEWELGVGKAYYEREQNQLATLAGAPRTPGAPGQSAQQQLTTVEGGNEFDVLRKYFPNGTH